jgi:hypothetical protein
LVTYQFSAVSIDTLRALTHYLKRASQPVNMKLWMGTFKYCDIYVTNCTIYVPFGTIQKRKLLDQFQEAAKDATNLSLNSR